MTKCRPPGNRNPSKSEIETCFPYLETQIALINPKIIVTLGNVPTQYLLETTQGITKIRGQWHDCLFSILPGPLIFLIKLEGIQ